MLRDLLKAVGKDLSHLGSWIEDGLKIAEPVVGILDPSLLPLMKALEDLLLLIPQPATGTISAQHLQDIVTAVTAVTALKNSGVITAAALAAVLNASSTPPATGTSTVAETATATVTTTAATAQ